MESSKLIQYLHTQVLKCTLCNEHFKTPKSLPCLHVFCEACIKAHISENTQSGSYTCPQCQETHHVSTRGTDDLRNAFLQESLLEALTLLENKPMLCTSCGSGKQAEAACRMCEDFLCADCEAIHKRIRLTRNHTLVPMDTLTDPETLAAFQQGRFHPCQEHPAETSTLFCNTDHSHICLKCSADSKHNGHDFTPIETKLQALKADIQRYESQQEEIVERVRQSQTLAKACISDVKEREVNDIELLTKRTKKLQKLINKYEKDTRSRIEKHSQSQQNVYKTHIAQCEDWIKQNQFFTQHKGVLEILPPSSALEIAMDITNSFAQALSLSSMLSQEVPRSLLFENVHQNGIREAFKTFIGLPHESVQNTSNSKAIEKREATQDLPGTANNVATNSQAKLPKEKGLEIFIKTLSGKSHAVNVHKSTNVTQLKNIIKGKVGVAMERQSLMHAGQRLRNHTTLADYNIQHHSTVYLSY